MNSADVVLCKLDLWTASSNSIPQVGNDHDAGRARLLRNGIHPQDHTLLCFCEGRQGLGTVALVEAQSLMFCPCARQFQETTPTTRDKPSPKPNQPKPPELNRTEEKEIKSPTTRVLFTLSCDDKLLVFSVIASSRASCWLRRLLLSHEPPQEKRNPSNRRLPAPGEPSPTIYLPRRAPDRL